MRKGERTIEINVDSRWFYVFVLLVVIALGAVVVNALPSDDGHSVDEIQGICYSSGTGCTFMEDYYTKVEFDNAYD